ncbi:MFS transporter [Kutzneria sp. 744]|uniref:MFS transporter n=1 Tax=Kutzneria sp. (strain 744) TaxID=345341 RepID=UPI0003EEB8C2|nr:MFS transporter [Kutzneria sp. 744]EWM18779.1 integral membrane efflux protein [Kutzneria sp. 744]
MSRQSSEARSRSILLAEKNFRRYFLARTVSLCGDMMFPVAITAAMLAIGYGASGIGLVLAANLAPMVAFMLVGGALADRFRPKPLMLVADATRLAAQGGLAFALLVGRPDLWLILVLQAVCGLATAAFQPGMASMVTEVAPGRLRQANALLRISESMTVMGGPALAGLLLAFAQPAVVVAANAATFLASGLLLAAVRISGRTTTGGRPSMLKDLRAGWREFASRQWLWVVIVVFALLGLSMFGPYTVLSATVLAETHGVSAYGLLVAVFGAGAVAGGALALRRSPSRPLLAGALALFAYVPQFALIALGAPVGWVAAGMLIAGGGRSYWAVMWSTAVQSHVPRSVLSRVSAYEITGSMVLNPLGRAIAGPISDAVGASAVLLAAGLFGAAGCAVLVSVPAVRDLRPAAPHPTRSPRPI